MISAETNRFHRPMDVSAVRRNQRQVHTRRFMLIAANVSLALSLAAGASWLYRRTQSDARFSVRRVEASGAMHTASSAITAITAKYVGTNLFRLDIEQLRREMTALPWVERVAIEKRIPDTLAIHVFERQPVALVSAGRAVRYVDTHGASFAELSVKVGDPELPLISGASAVDLPRTVAFLERLRAADRELYSHVSEAQPIEPDAFVVFDRALQTFVTLRGNESLDKWRALYSIVEQEGYATSGVEYADLRFDDRIVVKPRVLKKTAPVGGANVSTGITN